MGWTVVSEETTKVEDSNPGVWLNAAKSSVDRGDYILASEQIRKANYYDKNGYYKKDFASVVVPLCKYFLSNSQPSKSISLINDIFINNNARMRYSLATSLYILLIRSYWQAGDYGKVSYYCGRASIKYIADCHFLMFWTIVAITNLIIPYNVVTAYDEAIASVLNKIIPDIIVTGVHRTEVIMYIFPGHSLFLIDFWETVKHSADISYNKCFNDISVLIFGSLITFALLSCRLNLRNNDSFVMWLIWLSLGALWLVGLLQLIVAYVKYY